MRFDVITLFPELFAPFLASGVTRRAYESGLVDVKLWNPREFADGNYRRVDDRPFGRWARHGDDGRAAHVVPRKNPG
jgi:tRNA (guanine37-N1)-methyltransferase